MMDDDAKRRVIKHITEKHMNKPVRIIHHGFFFARCGSGSQLIAMKMEEVTCVACRKLCNADKIIKRNFGGQSGRPS